MLERTAGVDPWAYLRDVLDRVGTHPARRIDELLPDRWEAIRRGREGAAPAQGAEAPADPLGLGAQQQGQQSGIRDGP